MVQTIINITTSKMYYQKKKHNVKYNKDVENC